jgi:hypothetical protein
VIGDTLGESEGLLYEMIAPSDCVEPKECSGSVPLAAKSAAQTSGSAGAVH